MQTARERIERLNKEQLVEVLIKLTERLPVKGFANFVVCLDEALRQAEGE